MKADLEKSKDELIEELANLRQQAARCEALQSHLTDVENSFKDLQARFDHRTRELEKECLDRDHTEEALRMAEVIIDYSPAILFRRSAGEDRRLVYVSDNVRQLGYTAEEFLSNKIHFRDIVYPDDMERVGEEIGDYAEEDVEEYTQFYRLIHKSGEVRWVEDRTSVVRDTDGNKIFNQGILVDITARKLAEEEVRKSEEKFRRIVETAGEGFLLMDENLRIVDVNNTYCNLLGYSREELIGKTPLDLATEEFKQFMESNSVSILAEEYREIEGTVIAKNGRQVPILIHGSTLRDDSDNVIGNMAFVTDMTEHK